jgi:hypothetical protein
MMPHEDLRKIKAGDEIAISRRFNNSLEKVAKVTPTGRIKLTNGDAYDKNGRLIGEHYNYSFIIPMKEYYKYIAERKEKEEKTEIFNQINLNMRLSKEQLERILAITKEAI